MEKFTVLNGLVAPLDRSNVDTDAIEACQNNGVLTVKIPKKRALAVSEKKKIAVK